MSLVKLENISKIYHSGENTFHALKGIYFQLERAEMLAIVGTSGSGKSTLMNILGFLDRGTSGNYFYSGENVSHLKNDELARIRNQKIGFVFQSFFLIPRLTALQNVMLPLFYRKISKHEAEEKSLSILKKIGMEKFIKHKPNQLSGGQQQRVAIARALVGDPEMILADEPTGALDSKTGQDILNLLIELNQTEKRTIVIVTHDHQVSLQCHRTVTMKDGLLCI